MLASRNIVTTPMSTLSWPTFAVYFLFSRNKLKPTKWRWVEVWILGPFPALCWLNLRTEVSPWKRIKCFPSPVRRRSVTAQQSLIIFGFACEENSVREIMWLYKARFCNRLVWTGPYAAFSHAIRLFCRDLHLTNLGLTMTWLNTNLLRAFSANKQLGINHKNLLDMISSSLISTVFRSGQIICIRNWSTTLRHATCV